MPKRRRADLHETFAELLEPVDSVEPLAFHLEQAVLCRREIGPDDPRTADYRKRLTARLF